MLNFFSKVSIFFDVSMADPMRRKDNWLRICLLLFMFAIPMQLLVVFSGVLTSSMTVREPEDHIKTAEDVLRFKNLRVYAEARTSLSLLFLVCLNDHYCQYYYNYLHDYYS